MKFGKLLVGVVALLIIAGPAASQTEKLGVVFMHGKQGHPGQPQLASFVRKIESAGFALEQPTMCWTQSRLYDRSLPDCLAELEAPMARLRQRGITRIAVGGHSQGGLGALAYGARTGGLQGGGLHGIFALAPAPPPGVVNRSQIQSSIQAARELIAAGRGDESHIFEDVNLGPQGQVTLNVRSTANMIMTFWDMNGPANLVKDASEVRVPLLWVSGAHDPSQLPKEAGFDKVPPGPLNRYARVDADHMGTPDAAADIVVEWLRGLGR